MEALPVIILACSLFGGLFFFGVLCWLVPGEIVALLQKVRRARPAPLKEASPLKVTESLFE